MRIVNMVLVGIFAISSPSFAEEKPAPNSADGWKTYQGGPYPGMSPNGASLPYLGAGIDPSSPDAQAQYREKMSKMSIDRKAYVDEIMKSFDLMDRDKDGKLSAEELSMAPATDKGDGLMRPNNSKPVVRTPVSRTPVTPNQNNTISTGSVGIPPINAKEIK